MTLKQKLETVFPTKTFTVVFEGSDMNLTINGKTLKVKKQHWPNVQNPPSSIVEDVNIQQSYFDLVCEMVEQIN